VARIEVVRDTLHGTVVEDPHRWLENWDDPEVRAWTDSQNAYTRRWLDRIPDWHVIDSRFDELLKIGYLASAMVRGDVLFYEKREGTQDQPVLYVKHIGGEARTLIDPNTLSEEGIVALDWYYPSPDGELLAYGLSEGGSEQSTLRIINVATGEALDDVIPRTRGCGMAWSVRR